MNDQPVKNTDRQIWRRDPEDYYSPSIHVTEGGGIGIDVGGTVHVRPVEDWFYLDENAIEFAVRWILGDNHFMKSATIKMVKAAWKAEKRRNAKL